MAKTPSKSIWPALSRLLHEQMVREVNEGVEAYERYLELRGKKRPVTPTRLPGTASLARYYGATDEELAGG